MKTLRTRAVVLTILSIVFHPTATSNAGTMITTGPALEGCPPVPTAPKDKKKGEELAYQIVDDNGNSFTLKCIDDNYYQGFVFNKATGKTEKFGRCIYDWGLNNQFFDLDAKKNLKGIAWINVSEDGYNTGSAADAKKRQEILDGIAEKPGESRADWEKRVKDFAMNFVQKDGTKGLEFQFYATHFSPGDQDIFTYNPSTGTTSMETLTPEQANADYQDDGMSPDPRLVIESDMRTVTSNQLTGTNLGVPEPSTLALFSFGAVAFLWGGVRRRRNFRSAGLVGASRAPIL